MGFIQNLYKLHYISLQIFSCLVKIFNWFGATEVAIRISKILVSALLENDIVE